MNWFIVEMVDKDGRFFEFECEAASSDEAEGIANDEHENAVAMNVRMA